MKESRVNFHLLQLPFIDYLQLSNSLTSQMCKILLHFLKMCKEFLHFLIVEHVFCLVFIQCFVKKQSQFDAIRCPLLVMHYIDLIHPEPKNG